MDPESTSSIPNGSKSEKIEQNLSGTTEEAKSNNHSTDILRKDDGGDIQDGPISISNENSSKPTTALLARPTPLPSTVIETSKIQIETPQPDDAAKNAAADDDGGHVYRVYGKRWFVLLVASLLNCSNTMSWISYAPVSNFVDCYYGGKTATWLSLVFLVAAIPVALAAMWSVRRYGLRSAVLLAAWTNGIGALIRLLSSALPNPASRYIVLLGQLFAAIAYPFIMFLPTKVAANWFGDSQRAMATTIATMSNPLGVLFANLIAPQLVVEKSDVFYLNILLSVVPVATTILATIGIRESDPPTPPGHAAAQTPMKFWAGVKKCMTSRAFWMLLLALGGGMGMFNALYTMMQQILCSRGYSNSFAGLCCILMILGGLCGATASAKIVDKTKKFEETMKVSFGLAVIGGVSFSVVALKPDVKIVIGLCCTLFGFFGLAAYPIGLETGAECTYPAAETTSTGLIVLSGQIQGALYILLFGFMAQPLTGLENLAREQCSVRGHGVGSDTSECGREDVKPKDMTVAMMIFASVATVLAIVFICLFKPRYKRNAVERTGKAAPSKSKKNASGKIGNEQNGETGEVELKVIKNNKRNILSQEPLVENA